MKKKIGLTIGVIALLVVAIIAWYLYPVMMGQPDQDEMALLEEILQEEGVSDADLGESDDVITEDIVIGEGETNEDSVGKETDKAAGIQETGTVLSPKEKKARVEAKYEAQCRALQITFQGKLNGLVSAAMREYKSMGSDVSNLDKLKLARKYIGLGNALEGQCDGRFEAIMSHFTQELKAEGLSVDTVERARKLYAAQKSSQKKKLLDKAME